MFVPVPISSSGCCTATLPDTSGCITTECRVHAFEFLALSTAASTDCRQELQLSAFVERDLRRCAG